MVYSKARVGKSALRFQQQVKKHLLEKSADLCKRNQRISRPYCNVSLTTYTRVLYAFFVGGSFFEESSKRKWVLLYYSETLRYLVLIVTVAFNLTYLLVLGLNF